MAGSFTLPSFAKINWDLRILGKRDDGFHELCTTFQTISLQDDLTFEQADQISLTCSDPSIPVNSSNLILRAAEALRKEYSTISGARIHLEKRVPSPGGLGGASSNAAVALIGLSALWKLDIGIRELENLGSHIG